MQWRASVAKVCTSEARKIRVPLARARDGVPQEGLVSLLGAERMNCFSGRCGASPLERVAEEGAGSFRRRTLQIGGDLPL